MPSFATWSARPRTSSCGCCRSSGTAWGRIRTAKRGSRPCPSDARRDCWRASSGSSRVSSERRPVLLVMEDLHRADAGTRTLVSFLARIARAQRLAIVGTYQGDAIRRDDPWAMDLGALAAAPRPPGRMTLGPLGRDDLARIDRVDRGRATIGQRPGDRRRAVGRPPAAGRGTARGAARVADGVPDLVVRGPRPGAGRRALARVPARAPTTRPGRSTHDAGRPGRDAPRSSRRRRRAPHRARPPRRGAVTASWTPT